MGGGVGGLFKLKIQKELKEFKHRNKGDNFFSPLCKTDSKKGRKKEKRVLRKKKSWKKERKMNECINDTSVHVCTEEQNA